MAESIHDKINQRGSAEAWAKFVIEKWQKEIRRKGIGKTNELINSFEREIQAAGGDVKQVELRFLFHGRFRDMGVGRGLKGYERQTNKASLIAAKRYGAEVDYTHRQPKKWYNKIKTAQTYRLAEILVSNTGDILSQDIANQWQNSININI